MNALLSSAMIYLSGRLVGDPVFSETSKGKPMCRLLIEVELVREVGRGEFRPETYPLPIIMFSWVADQARDLRRGDSVMVAARLNGTKFEKPGEEPKHGVQLIGEGLFFPPARKE